jgi:hypothetical protein
MMKRTGLILALVAVLVACASFWPRGHVFVIHAQSLPITKTLVWDANPVGDGVTGYTVRLDGVVIGNPTLPSQAFTVTTVGAHTLTVVATNTWGSSAPGTLNINVIVPSNPANLRVP